MHNNTSHVGVQHFLKKIDQIGLNRENVSGLVIGFGEGHEAEYLQTYSKTKVYGIDLHSRVPKGEKVTFSPLLASAIDLPFKSTSFDYIFYHHVIEHVTNPEATLVEIQRLLNPGGFLYIGTPNRNRLIGYFGAYNIPLRRKIRNNLVDYKYRIFGKFRNELGAHAGFSHKELENMLAPNFVNIEWLTKEYMDYKYQHRLPSFLKNIFNIEIVMNLIVPSIYVCCYKANDSMGL